ncbi:hypothetical protein PGTUg99_012366 [Puccinia graminis f. sp. tritici]|uniref:Uncharacterized protein n=1 Tax=Puccinia graminis f. sp. tritici TaxID=56615 RepID=A0A5B0PMV4_PUCGR|nr:hypothetical protein PGTUg99_012366 [Puccinia graminis f. sp. tritici]
MRAIILTSILGVNLLHIPPGFATMCYLLTCNAEGVPLKEHVIDFHQLPRQAACGRYTVMGEWKECKNLRQKEYFHCETCNTIWRENVGTVALRVCSGVECNKDHYTKEKIDIGNSPPTLQNYLGNVGGGESSAPGPSSRGA